MEHKIDVMPAEWQAVLPYRVRMLLYAGETDDVEERMEQIHLLLELARKMNATRPLEEPGAPSGKLTESESGKPRRWKAWAKRLLGWLDEEWMLRIFLMLCFITWLVAIGFLIFGLS